MKYEKENIRTEKPSSDKIQVDDFGNEVAEVESNPLKSEANERILNKLKDWFYQERVYHAQNRIERATNSGYYHGYQFTDSEKKDIEDAGEAALVYNEIKSSINWLLGTELRNRVDWKIEPRAEDDVETSKIKTKVLKYYQDINRFTRKKSRAFMDTCTAGIGWLDHSINNDPSEELISIGWEDWRNVWWDHLSVQDDLSDCRYIFRRKFLDLDFAIALFPEMEAYMRNISEDINRAIRRDDDDTYQSALYWDYDRVTNLQNAMEAGLGAREIVALVECQFKKPVKKKVVRGADKSDPWVGHDYLEDNKWLKQEVDDGVYSIATTVQYEMWHAIFVENGQLLQLKRSPYRHNKFTLVPVWSYRDDKSGLPYSPIRDMKDPQDDLNKRMAKALFVLNNKQVIMDEGAVTDEEQVADDINDPRAIFKVKKGYRFEINKDNALAQQHIDIALRSARFIKEVSGITSENLGLQSNAVSGKAITARQSQGTVVTAILFDHVSSAFQLSGEITLSLIEQFDTDQKVFRIVGDDGMSTHMEVNVPDEQSPTGRKNDITARKADFIVSEADHRETIRMAMFDQLMTSIGMMPPELSLQLLDLAFQLADIPNKSEFINRIREVSGRPPLNETPEQKAQREDAAKAKQQQQIMMQLQLAIAEIKTKDAEAQHKFADALVKKLEALKFATALGVDILNDPHAASAADQVLENLDALVLPGKTQQELQQMPLENGAQ